MKSNLIRKAAVALLAALMALPAMAQEDALKDYPGYVDFGSLGDIFGEPTVQVSVGESLLGLVGSLSAQEDPEAAELFKRLNGVRINVFEGIEVSPEGIDFVKDVSSKLLGMGWESVVTVNDGTEQVRIFMKIDNDTVHGITVMAVDETEAAFINVIGNLKPDELEKVMDNFDVDIDE
jgi:hypothetical protein